jgi:hypothetical protein
MAVSYLQEKAAIDQKEALIALYNQIPDAVIVLEPMHLDPEILSQTHEELHSTYSHSSAVTYRMHYCNHQTDQFFDIGLSTLNRSELRKSDYILL